MTGRITEKTIVVTGGSRGIGLQWVLRLLQQGNTVMATARDPAASPGLQELSQEFGDKLLTSKLESSSEEGIAQWAADIKSKVAHIDVLINNAGLALEEQEPGISDITTKTLADTMVVNAYGPILVVKELLKQGLLGGDSPTLVVYTSSAMASMGGYAFPIAKMYAYRASKAALNMLVVTSVEELTPKNITSVLLHPGYVATDMTAGKPGTISVDESIAAQLAVLEDGRPLNGKFYDYTGVELAF